MAHLLTFIEVAQEGNTQAGQGSHIVVDNRAGLVVGSLRRKDILYGSVWSNRLYTVRRHVGVKARRQWWWRVVVLSSSPVRVVVLLRSWITCS